MITSRLPPVGPTRSRSDGCSTFGAARRLALLGNEDGDRHSTTRTFPFSAVSRKKLTTAAKQGGYPHRRNRTGFRPDRKQRSTHDQVIRSHHTLPTRDRRYLKEVTTPRGRATVSILFADYLPTPCPCFRYEGAAYPGRKNRIGHSTDQVSGVLPPVTASTPCWHLKCIQQGLGRSPHPTRGDRRRKPPKGLLHRNFPQVPQSTTAAGKSRAHKERPKRVSAVPAPVATGRNLPPAPETGRRNHHA